MTTKAAKLTREQAEQRRARKALSDAGYMPHKEAADLLVTTIVDAMRWAVKEYGNG